MVTMDIKKRIDSYYTDNSILKMSMVDKYILDFNKIKDYKLERENSNMKPLEHYKNVENEFLDYVGKKLTDTYKTFVSEIRKQLPLEEQQVKLIEVNELHEKAVNKLIEFAKDEGFYLADEEDIRMYV